MQADDLSLELRGGFAAALAADADNLVLRAARALARHAGIQPRARLVLEKALPVASGIGGGSADAAATLHALARLWGVALDAGDAASLALTLGADVPVCLAGRAARMRGIGDVLTPAPVLPACGIVLANPGVPVATAAIFRARAGAFSSEASLPQAWPDAHAMAADLARMTNDLEAPAAMLCSPIGAVLAALRARAGCLLARMSGSGATCFALFESAPVAEAAAAALRHPGWWAWGGALHQA
jgi:4-diphosphocytidyl-2-C-methyl-D-erythritol kinase